MEISFQQRCQGIVGDCRQFKLDVDSYNDSHPDGEPIQIVFDFSMDLDNWKRRITPPNRSSAASANVRHERQALQSLVDTCWQTLRMRNIWMHSSRSSHQRKAVKLPEDALAFPEVGTLTKIRSPDSVTNSFIIRARKLGFPIHIHDLGASHSTARLDRGVPLHVVAKRIGDDPATLLRSYAKSTKKADANAAEAIAALMKGVL
jgi:hypothetical protein